VIKLEAAQLGFDSWQGKEVFLFVIMSRLAVGPIQSLLQWEPAALSKGVKQTKHEANHSLLSSAEDKKEWSYTSTLSHIFTS
jgi:hypothetical protein